VTKEKSLKGTGDGSEALAIEVGIFKGLKFSSTALIIIPTIMLVLSLVIVAASIIIVSVGKGKDKIVFMDASGRPSLIRADDPDRIYWPELEVFCKDAIKDILAWTYVEVKSKDDLAVRTDRLARHFDPASFKAFYGPYRDNYLKSLADQKLVVTAEWQNLKDVKMRGKEAVVLVAVRLNAVRVIGEEAANADIKIKVYEIKLYKGVRSVENPFGLYVVRFSEPVAG
jgi:hypothetical protein